MKRKKNLIYFWPQLLIVCLIFAFFAKLFFPPSFFVTPDYGRSDLLHSKIPTQLVMWQSLRSKTLPLWDSRIGQGFPVFDEGEMGFFFLPNLLLFSQLPFWLAFNLGYVATLIISAFGTYLLARSLNTSKIAAFASAITFAFSPIFVLHFHHYNLIETASVVPWLFWLVNSFVNSKKLIYLSFVPFFIAQQSFAGFPQFVVYTLFFLFIFFTLKIWPVYISRFSKLKIMTLFTAFICLGLLIASIQLEGSYRLAQEAKRFQSLNPQKILSDFPYNYKNLMTLLNPFILGNIKDASYPHWKPGSWGLFWESNSYFGIIQLILILGFLTSIIIKKSKTYGSREIAIWVFIGSLGVILALGSSAPLHPLFSIPPFQIFRVPARFLLFSFLSAALLTAISIDRLKSTRHLRFSQTLILIVTLLIATDAFRVWRNYNLTEKVDNVLTPPQMSKYIEKGGRILTIWQEIPWNKTFIEKGWANQNDLYMFYRNFLGQNSNILYNVPQVFAYESILPKRSQHIENIILVKHKDEKAEISKVSQHILNMTSVKYITIPNEISSNKWQQIKLLEKEDQKIYLYKNLESLPHVYTVQKYKIAKTIQGVSDILSSEDFNDQETVILEKDIDMDQSRQNVDSQAEITNYQNNFVAINTNSTAETLVILTDSYDKAWEATIDGQKTAVLPANINSRAVVVPAGKHVIEYRYLRNDIKISGVISLLAAILSLAIIIKSRKITL